MLSNQLNTLSLSEKIQNRIKLKKLEFQLKSSEAKTHYLKLQINQLRKLI